MANLHLVRHGQARFGEEDYDRLSDLGVVQSEALGRWLASTGQQAGRIVCGTLRRHRQTAEAALTVWGHPAAATGPLASDARLDEFNHREVLAKCWPQYARHEALSAMLAESEDPRRTFQDLFRAGMERWIEGRHDADYTESWQAFRDRCVAGIEAASVEADGSEDIWVFTSGGPIAAIAQYVLGVSDAKAVELSWSILNCSVTRMAKGRRGMRLISFNTVAHLELSATPGLITHR